MASAFKESYKNNKGVKVECSGHTVKFADCSDPSRAFPIYRKVPGFEAYDVSLFMGHQLEKLAELRRSNDIIPEHLRLYIDGLPAKVRAKLAKWGLLSYTSEAAKMSLEEHVQAYEQALRDGVASRKQKGRPAVPRHVQNIGAKIRFLLKSMNVRTFADITPATMARALNKMETKGVRSKGIGSKTKAHYFGSVFAFLQWCERQRLIAENPLKYAAKPDATAEIRHKRRAYSSADVAKLLNTARAGTTRYRMTGEDRYWLYRFAVETGIRAGEIRGLIRSNLVLDGDNLSVTVPAKVAKNRRERTIPLKPETAAGLKTYLGTKLPTASVFKLPKAPKIVLMLKADLEKASIDYEDELGRRLDFHALRVTFITNLIAAGVNVKTVQELAGHSSSDMTLDVYAKVLKGTPEDAVRRLPSYERLMEEAARATGTDGKAVHEHGSDTDGRKTRPKNRPNSGTFRGSPAPSSAKSQTQDDIQDCAFSFGNQTKTPANAGASVNAEEMGDTGLEPVTPSLSS